MIDQYNVLAEWCMHATSLHFAKNSDTKSRARRYHPRDRRLGDWSGRGGRAPDNLLSTHLGFAPDQENAAPEVRADLEAYFESIAPEDRTRYSHNHEGADDMPAHLRTALTSVHLSVPVMQGRPALGTWQAIYLFEHRQRAHLREIALQLLGE